LLDYVSWAEANNISINQFSTNPIPVSTLKQIASNQGTSFRRGDILFIRTGWTEAYTRLSTAEQQTLAATYPPPAIGLESSEKTLRWLWDHEFAAVVGDQPSFEAWPCQNLDFLLHEWILAGWGMPIGELFDLKQLSEECRKRARWEFFFSSMPLKVGSPPPACLLETLNLDH
jgi:kynurenine formamidase